MADQNPISKALSKHAGRAKERILQNLGRADRTTDEDFDLHIKNFAKQQAAVLGLHKEFKNYYQCLRAIQTARRSLMDTVCELYEPCWDGLDQFMLKTELTNRNFEDFCDKVNHELLIPVSNFMNQFPDIVSKISKRKRKLLDYDNSRHNLENLETMRKREDAKIAKAKEQLDDARNHFEVINSELHEELPALYDSRVSFFATNLQSLFLMEAEFHNSDGAMFLDISKILESLNEAYKEGSFSEKIRLSIESPKNGGSKIPEYILTKKGKPEGDVQVGTPVQDAATVQEDTASLKESGPEFSTPPTTIERETEMSLADISTEVLAKMDKGGSTEEVKSDEKGSVEIPQADLNVLYQVRGTYKYAAEDVDELSFNVGDVIDVVAYDDPEEQEDGWLMGVFDGKKGLFPANFTSRI